MTLSVKNLDWIRKVKVDGVPDFGPRMYELVNSIAGGVNTLEQQTNSNLSGNPGAPPQPQGIKVIPHPTGVDVSIQHDGEYYKGISYHVDYADNPHFQNARTHDLGATRNTVIPVGQWSGYYQVRALYPNGQSSSPVIFGGAIPSPVHGGSVTRVALLPGEGAGTTAKGQPPGFGGPFRSANGAPPKRNT